MRVGRDLPQVHNVTNDQVGPLLDKSWHLRRHASLATDSLMHVATPPSFERGGWGARGERPVVGGGYQEYSHQRD